MREEEGAIYGARRVARTMEVNAEEIDGILCLAGSMSMRTGNAFICSSSLRTTTYSRPLTSHHDERLP